WTPVHFCRDVACLGHRVPPAWETSPGRRDSHELGPAPVLSPTSLALHPSSGPWRQPLRAPRGSGGHRPAAPDGFCLRAGEYGRVTPPGRPGHAGDPRPVPAADGRGARLWRATARPPPSLCGGRLRRRVVGPAVAGAPQGGGHGGRRPAALGGDL